MPRRRIALLGGTGFVGSALTAALIARGDDVLVVGRTPQGHADTGRVRRLVVDLTAPGALGTWLGDHDVVVDLAVHTDPVSRWRVIDDDAARRVNVDLVTDLVTTVAHVTNPPDLVLVSSVAAAPENGPLLGYAAHKAAAEATIIRAARDGRARGTAIRLPTVYGAGPTRPIGDRGMVAALARQALAGSPLTLWGGGAVRRSLLHVTDAARALIAAIDNGTDLIGQVWTAGPAASTPVRDVARLVAAAAHRHTGVLVPLVDTPPPSHAAPSDLTDVDTDASGLTDTTGWRPTVDLTDGIDDLVAGLVAELATPRAPARAPHPTPEPHLDLA